MEDVKKAIDSDNELHIRILRDTLCDLKKENFQMKIAVCVLLIVSVLCAVSVFCPRRGCQCPSPCYGRHRTAFSTEQAQGKNRSPAERKARKERILSETSRRINRFFKSAIKKEVDEAAGKIALSDRQSVIFNDFYVRRSDVNTIADKIGSSPETVYKELKAIRRKLIRII